MDAKMVMEILLKHQGVENGITATQLVQLATNSLEPNLAAERRLRSVITQLRMDGAMICSHPSTGYFLATSLDEMTRTLVFLRSRAMTSLIQESKLRKVALPELLGQLKLEMENAA